MIIHHLHCFNISVNVSLNLFNPTFRDGSCDGIAFVMMTTFRLVAVKHSFPPPHPPLPLSVFSDDKMTGEASPRTTDR